MIHHKGILVPTKAQLADIRKEADDSFCQNSSLGFMQPFPVFDGWQLAEDKAKAENETLRRENAALREQLARMKAKEQSREKAEQEKQGEQNAED